MAINLFVPGAAHQATSLCIKLTSAATRDWSVAAAAQLL
jgi:hypothetical protein